MKGEWKEEERGRNMCLPRGTWPATQACALTRNQTCDPLVCSLCSVCWAKPARARLSFMRFVVLIPSNSKGTFITMGFLYLERRLHEIPILHSFLGSKGNLCEMKKLISIYTIFFLWTSCSEQMLNTLIWSPGQKLNSLISSPYSLLYFCEGGRKLMEHYFFLKLFSFHF